MRSGPMKKAKHWWSGWTQAQWDEGALCKEEEVGRDPGPLRSGGAGHGRGAKPTAVKSAWKRWRSAVSEGEQARQRPRKGPCRVAGGSGRAGAAAAGVVAKSTAKASWPGRPWAAIGESNMAIGAGPADSIEPVEICPPLLLMARVVGGCRAAAKEHDIVARKSSADGPVGRWLMNMKISELKLGRLGEAGLEKASLVGGIGGSLLLGTELPGAAKQGRARRARGGRAMCQS